jgi:putative RecB family exonuclease
VYDVPTSLSPSRVDAFVSCPLAFRFSSIERIPEPPSVHTTKGSLVHRALEVLFTRAAGERTPAAAHAALDVALAEYRVDPDFTMLGLDSAAVVQFEAECRTLVDGYLGMEDPSAVREIGLELRLEAVVGDLTLRGIIDRLELDADGELVVTDYKTGRAPSANFESKSLAGVHFYAFLCNEVLGRRPSKVRLMYLRSGETITTRPDERSVRFISTRAKAVIDAVGRACRADDFRPKPSALCGSCSFQRWCPEFGGDPSLAAIEAPVVLAGLAA